MIIWENVIGYGGKYQVSNDGKIRNKKTGRILKQHITQQGQKALTLSFKSVYDNTIVSRVVAEYFVPNPNNYRYVIHKDGNKENLNADNLEWSYENTNALKSMTKVVIKMDENYNEVDRFESCAEAARSMFCDRSNISRVANNGKMAYGYYWKYESEVK